jgi:phage tail tape-measure protein
MSSTKKTHEHGGSENRDPISGEKGAHPIGTGIGAAAGGAAIGAAGGAVAGPAGAAVGAVVGGVAGGLAGKGVAEHYDPTVETSYWRDNYTSRPYYEKGHSFEEYEPAYRYGWESRSRYNDRSFDDVETDLARDWDRVRGHSRMTWDKARPATRDAWDRLGTSMTRKG